MGRLFWKFFIFIWLAQMAGMVTVGTTFWLRHQAYEQSHLHFNSPPPQGAPYGALPTPPPWDGQRGILPPPPPPPGQPSPFPLEPLIATLLASLVCAVLLARYFSSPIRHLRNALNAAANGNLLMRVGTSMGNRRDELTDLGHDFDRMADQLNTLMDAQRRLLHDISHELRSPLARMQAAIGLVRQRPEKLEATMDRLELESGRIDHLIGELLTLSKLEVGVMEMADEKIQINELLADIVTDARFEAEVNRQEVLFEAKCETSVRGQSELLHRAIENIVRNALKHTPPGKRIIVDCVLHAPSQAFHIIVMDEGPGVAEAELPWIFEPFFRGRGAKSTDGHGLGLAIAKRIIQAHGGTIQASNRPIGGLCVEVSLPLDPRVN